MNNNNNNNGHTVGGYTVVYNGYIGPQQLFLELFLLQWLNSTVNAVQGPEMVSLINSEVLTRETPLYL